MRIITLAVPDTHTPSTELPSVEALHAATIICDTTVAGVVYTGETEKLTPEAAEKIAKDGRVTVLVEAPIELTYDIDSLPDYLHDRVFTEGHPYDVETEVVAVTGDGAAIVRYSTCIQPDWE